MKHPLIAARLVMLLGTGLAAIGTTGAADAPVQVPILVYHHFGAQARDEMTVRTQTFAWQLRYLESHGFRVIRLRDYVRYRQGAAPAPPARAVIITADDGRRSVYTDMRPLVLAYHVPVTLFIYPSAISNASYAMTWAQLAELVHTGLFDVESHTYWHPNFRIEKARSGSEEYRQSVRMQLTRSKAVLEQRLGVRVDMLAWPFGLYDADLMSEASRAGYIAACSLERRSAGPADPLLALPRYIVTEGDVGARFARLLGSARPPRAAASGPR